MLDKHSSFLKGAALLTAAALFVKLLSAVYRVPFQNMVGDTGFYIYQQVYPFYGIAAVLAVTGIPVVMSRFFAEADIRRRAVVAHTAFVTTALLGLLLFAGLFFGADIIASWMADEALTPLIRLSAVFFLIMPYAAVQRGLHQGAGQMQPTASSQMVEQSVRVGGILVLAYWAVQSGRTLYDAGLMAVTGSLVGMMAGAMAIWRFRTPKQPAILSLFDPKLARAMIRQGTLVCMTALVLLLLQLADSFQLYSGLLESGIPADEAKEWKGIYDRGQPLLQLGVVAAVSLSSAIVPLVAKARLEGNQAAAASFSRLAIRVSFALGLAASAGLAAVMRPVNIMLFQTAAGSGFLALFGLSIFMYSLLATCSALFQGQGNDRTPAAAALLTVAVKVGLNAALIPAAGLYGAAASTVLALGAGVLYAAFKWQKQHGPLLSPVFMMKSALATAVMALLVFAVIQPLSLSGAGRVWNAFLAMTGAGAGICLFFVFMLKWKIWRDEDLHVLPFGDRLARMRKKG